MEFLSPSFHYFTIMSLSSQFMSPSSSLHWRTLSAHRGVCRQGCGLNSTSLCPTHTPEIFTTLLLACAGLGQSTPGCQKADEVHKELRSHTDDLQTLIMTAQLRASYLFPLLLAGFVQTNPKPEKMKVSDYQRKWVRVQM